MSCGISIAWRGEGPLVARYRDALPDVGSPGDPAAPAFALCRCGGSKARPSCDGTHHHKGWRGDG
ncbi:MAG: CDGSH iron-sulfur domain-containing protein [Rhodosalinus sp.]